MRLIERASENEAKRNLVGIEKQIMKGVYILVHDRIIFEKSALETHLAHFILKVLIFLPETSPYTPSPHSPSHSELSKQQLFYNS